MILEESIEDLFINNIITTQALVSVYLKNSIRLKGYLISNNETAVILKHGATQMIYKNCISSISPEIVFSTF